MNESVWQSCADDVLSVLVTEQYTDTVQAAYADAFYETGLLPYHFPPGKWRSLLTAITDLRAEKMSVNWNNLASRVVDLVTQQWYADLVLLCDTIRIADFHENLLLLIGHGNRMAIVEALESGAKALRDGDDLEKTVNGVISEISSTGGQKIVAETALGSSERLDSIFEEVPAPIVSTGIDWLDKSIGGLREQRMLVIAGAYKSRKTTLMLNFLLSACRAGKRPAILSFENSIETTMMQVVAQLAIEWLLKSGKIAYTPEASVYWLSADSLMQAGRGYKSWTDLKVQAVDYARAELKGLADRMRFYDRSRNGGSLTDMASIQSVIRRDMHLYGGNVFAIDHQGLVDANGEVYEHTRSVSKFLQGISRMTDPHPIHLMVLAQLNENAIATNGGYSAGVKGGGDTSANADYVLRTTPVALNSSAGEFYDDRIELQVKHNRWGMTTGRNMVYFHPESGRIMPKGSS